MYKDLNENVRHKKLIPLRNNVEMDFTNGAIAHISGFEPYFIELNFRIELEGRAIWKAFNEVFHVIQRGTIAISTFNRTCNERK